MSTTASSLLKQLDRIKHEYAVKAAEPKLELLRALERRRLADADELLCLHEILCFLRAYPDGPEILRQVEGMLERFDERSDLKRLRRALADSGIAGTAIHFSFFWFTAVWLARRWPRSLTIDWSDFEGSDRLEELLHLLVPFAETPGLDMAALTVREWIDRLKGPDQTDASFLIRRFEKLRSDDFGRETHFEALDVPFRLSPAPGSPSRTGARYRPANVVYQTRPLARKRPSLPDEIRRPPVAVRGVTPREGRNLIDLVREAMVTRHRDLYSFSHADPEDVRLVDCGDGLQFACIGTIPERRLMLESVYGFLTLKNGVPIGYVLASSLFGSTEIAYNVFESFRGGEAAKVFGRVMGMARYLFDADAFSIDPYQLGYGNREGLESGAWWFYYKLGFRPEDPEVLKVLDGELRKMKRKRSHRSDLRTLNTLSSRHIFYYVGRPRKNTLAHLSLGNIGLRITDYLAERFGAERERGLRVCSAEAAKLLGVRSFRGFTRGERLAWERWSPLVLLLPRVASWSAEERKAIVRVVRAKGGRRESEFITRFDSHRRLRRAVLGLARDPEE